MKKSIILFLLAMISFNASSKNTTQIIKYIHSTPASKDQKIKAEYLVNSISRIFTEKWKKNTNTFKSISDDISISLSCYMHVSENDISSVGIELVDEIQTIMLDTQAKKQAYLAFMQQDMKVNHTRRDNSICEALV